MKIQNKLILVAMVILGNGAQAMDWAHQKNTGWTFGNRLLSEAAAIGDVAAVKKLLNPSPNIKAKDFKGQIGMMIDNAELKNIVANGINVNAQDATGTTALMRAALAGHTEICKILLDHGANPDLVNNYGSTAASSAAHNNHQDIVRLLQSRT